MGIHLLDLQHADHLVEWHPHRQVCPRRGKAWRWLDLSGHDGRRVWEGGLLAHSRHAAGYLLPCGVVASCRRGQLALARMASGTGEPKRSRPLSLAMALCCWCRGRCAGSDTDLPAGVAVGSHQSCKHRCPAAHPVLPDWFQESDHGVPARVWRGHHPLDVQLPEYHCLPVWRPRHVPGGDSRDAETRVLLPGSAWDICDLCRSLRVQRVRVVLRVGELGERRHPVQLAPERSHVCLGCAQCGMGSHRGDNEPRDAPFVGGADHRGP
mmetsp:Transcript_53183/g.119902  ORF Transcript_53183/g.119902 Transcript_53183/m.119902 type:complete len:267 (+) Transcript_53183:220-1020(+)